MFSPFTHLTLQFIPVTPSAEPIVPFIVWVKIYQSIKTFTPHFIPVAPSAEPIVPIIVWINH